MYQAILAEALLRLSAVAGTASTAGLTAWSGEIASADAPLVARLRRAGAILLGALLIGLGQAVIRIWLREKVVPRATLWAKPNSIAGRSSVLTRLAPCAAMARDFNGLEPDPKPAPEWATRPLR